MIPPPPLFVGQKRYCHPLPKFLFYFFMMMESDNKLRQAIKTFLATFHEVRRLVDFIEELPVRHEMKLLSYDDMTASKLTLTDIENLYRRLTHSTLTEDINSGIMDDFPDAKTITNRLQHLKYSINREDVFKIEDVDSAYGGEIPTTKILSGVMDYGEAYDYTNTVWGIYREWNLIIDCLKRVITDIEDDFLNPQPDTTTEQEQTVVKLPPELDTPQAQIIWSKAKHNGWINDDYSFNGTRQQMCYAADRMGQSLKLKDRWKPFIKLWRYKSMAQTRWRGEQGYESISKMKELKAVFSI